MVLDVEDRPSLLHPELVRWKSPVLPGELLLPGQRVAVPAAQREGLGAPGDQQSDFGARTSA